MPAHAGAESLKKPHHIVALRFSEVVNDHANCQEHRLDVKLRFLTPEIHNHIKQDKMSWPIIA